MTLPLIKIVQLTVTNRCQCNCLHCGVSKLRKEIKGELTLEAIDLLFRDFKLSGCLLVDLFGGEPTLRRDLFDIIKLGKSYRFMISLETNGYVIDETYMERLCASGLDQIYLSLDDYRAEYHDRTRRKPGCFERAVHALELGAKTDILMHVSIVPQTREFFTNGDMNRFMEFVLGHGAEKVRLLMPRFVGDSIREDGGPMCAGIEQELFSYVSPRYKDYIYVHTPGTPLGEVNVCTAKQVFCHVMSNGWVAPCPYFPLVFGDVTREPIVDIFERIQAHPLVRRGGDFCPMRDEEYIDSNIRGLGIDRPFFPITVDNQIDLGALCRAGCPNCALGSRSIPRPAQEIVRELGNVSQEYTRIEFYGGDAFLREDLFTILNHVPPSTMITLWSTCRQEPNNPAFMKHLRSYPIEAIKVHLPLQFMADIAHPDGARRLAEALRRMSSGVAWRYPIYLYVPMDHIPEFHAVFSRSVHQLGVERLYAFTREIASPLVNSVACFGRELGRVQLLWARKENPKAHHV